MTPHSYSLDSQAKSSDLAAKIAAANSPPLISAAVSAVESHLLNHSADLNRHFFSMAFPSLICKLFGFDDSSPPSTSPQKPLSCSSTAGWIDIVTSSSDLDLSGKVFNLLSPNGTLITSIMAVDRLNLVKYVFPAERLPVWVRFLLTSERDCRILSDLFPLFKNRVKEDGIKGNFQVQLNVFEYFIFWFAYYPVCRGNNENFSTVSVRNSSKFWLESWTSSIPVLASGNKRSNEHKIESNLYLRLLYAYLCAFVPMEDLSDHQPYRSSLLHYSSSYDDSVLLRAEFFVDTLVHYWLTDNDFSPLAVNVCKSFDLSFPFRSILGEIPPASGLGEVVKLFVKYLNLSSVVGTEVSNQVQAGGNSAYKKFGSVEFVKGREVGSVLPSFPSGGCWNSYVQRPLYRFILRTFLFCPLESSIKNISEVFSVWISYIEPWKLSKNEFAELDTMVDRLKNGQGNVSGESADVQYTSPWQGYVLSNYLFYSSMVMHFIGFAHKFLHNDAEAMVQMVSKVIDILTSSSELWELVKNVDTVFHSKSKSILIKFVPQIREQLQDWEDGLSESDGDGSLLHENWNRDLKLFSDSDDGGPQLLQLFILRAETELSAISGDNLANTLQSLASLKSRLCCLFGDHVMKQSPTSPRTMHHLQSRDELFTPRKVRSGSISNLKYKGDWLRRPISDDEVAWLAKLLIQLSNWLNQNLGLQGEGAQNLGLQSSSTTYVDVSNDGVKEYGMSDSVKAMVCYLGSGFLALRLAIARVMVKHGLKVNLRIFASKKFVMMLVLFSMFSMLRRAFRSLC